MNSDFFGGNAQQKALSNTGSNNFSNPSGKQEVETFHAKRAQFMENMRRNARD